MDFRCQEIEIKEVWESFLLQHSPQSLFQSWSWGEVEKKSGHSIYRLGLYSAKELLGIAQVFIIRAKRGTYLHVRQGPVFSSQKNELWEAFLKHLKSIAVKEKAWFIRVSPLISDSAEHSALLDGLQLLPSPAHEVDAERCWILDITKSEEELLSGMRKSTRYEVKKSLKSDITIIESTDIKDLDKFYTLYNETSKRHGFVTHMSISEEFGEYSKENELLMYLGYTGGQLIASAIVLFYGGQAIYHHGASLSSKIPVTYALQWKAIREAKRRGLSLYNFYGIAPENSPKHPWAGLTLFKKGFGGSEILYTHSRDYVVSAFYIIPRTIDTIRRRLRGYS